MKATGRWFEARLVARWVVLTTGALLVACSDTRNMPTVTPSSATPIPAASPTATPRPPATVTPITTEVAIVDQVIAAVAAKDADKLTALLRFWPRPCNVPYGVKPDGIGFVPCLPGLPIGTPIPVIGVTAGDEGNFFVQGRANGIGIEAFVANPAMVYAVLRAPTFVREPDIPGKYQIVFGSGMALSVDDQGVTYLTFPSVQPGQQSGAALIATGRFGHNPEYLVRP